MELKGGFGFGVVVGVGVGGSRVGAVGGLKF